MYQEQLGLCHRRGVQMKMMKQAHLEAILSKDRTIQNLTDMVAECEERIACLEGDPTGQRFVVCGCCRNVHSLVKHKINM